MFSKRPFLLIWEYIFSFSPFFKSCDTFLFWFLISYILTICKININTPPHTAWSSVAQTPEFDSHWPNPGFLCIISGVCILLVINSREYWCFEGTGSQEDDSNMHTAYAVYQCCRFCLCNFCSTSAPLCEDVLSFCSTCCAVVSLSSKARQSIRATLIKQKENLASSIPRIRFLVMFTLGKSLWND